MRIIGHRGAKGLAPENTLLSLLKAIEHGVDEVEFDVRVAKDNVPILHHDKAIIDPAGQTLAIAEHSYKTLKRHMPNLVTLAQALDVIDTKVIAHIEVKRGEPIKPIIIALNDFIGGRYSAGDLRLASKNQKTLRELHSALPDVPKVVIEAWSGLRARHRARQLDTKLLSMNQLWLWRGFISLMARRGWQVSAYTLNDHDKAWRWASYGLAGVITDFPDRFEK